jgi:hypothetical protein
MKEYSYKVMMDADDCHAKRAVAFHDERRLTWGQAAKEALKHLSSQTCARCGQNHSRDEFVAVDIERGEPDGVGGFYYRDVLPTYDDPNQLELHV